MTPEDPNFPHEEYAILLGSTAPGTARGLLSNATASKSSIDVALADIMCDARPSGVVLPKILRRKLRLLNKSKLQTDASKADPETKGESDAGQKQMERTFRALNDMARVPLLDRVAHYDAKRLHNKSPMANIQSNYDQAIENDKDDIRAHLPKHYEPPSSYARVDRSRVFSTAELEKKLSKANAALLDIQKQLHRGEEIYFQDTDVHGNMYKGWEAFIDSKPEHLGVPFDEVSALAPSTSSSAPTRKMHSDLRWFSSSCYAVENGSIRSFERRKGKGSPKKSSASLSATVSPVPANRLVPESSSIPRKSPLPGINAIPIPRKSPFPGIDATPIPRKSPRPGTDADVKPIEQQSSPIEPEKIAFNEPNREEERKPRGGEESKPSGDTPAPETVDVEAQKDPEIAETLKNEVKEVNTDSAKVESEPPPPSDNANVEASEGTNDEQVELHKTQDEPIDMKVEHDHSTTEKVAESSNSHDSKVEENDNDLQTIEMEEPDDDTEGTPKTPESSNENRGRKRKQDEDEDTSVDNTPDRSSSRLRKRRT